MEERNQILLSTASVGGLYGVSPERSFKFMKDTGFDGVEVALNTRAINWHRRLIRLASTASLEITFRRWQHTASFGSRLCRKFGFLPPPEAMLRSSLDKDFLYPITIPSTHWNEREHFPHTLIEPAMEAYEFERAARFSILQQWLQESKQKISFDPFRWIQYRFGGLVIPTPPRDILASVLPSMMELKDQIDQIRLYDFTPPARLGKMTIQERRLFPGEGIFPFRPFLEELAEMGWRGRIVWEIAPAWIILNFLNRARLKDLVSLIRDAGL